MRYTCDTCHEETCAPRYTRTSGESKLIFCSPSCYILWVNTKKDSEENNGSDPSE